MNLTRRSFLVSTLAATTVRSQTIPAALPVAVIGHTGAGNYGHGLDTMWLSLPETKIVAVADANEKGLEAAKQRLKVETGYLDYKKMLAEVKPTLVAVCPRHIDQHQNMILDCIDSGVRGIYVEKPFVRTPAEADEVIARAEKKKVKIAVAHRNRYHPVLPVLRQLLKEETIGRVLEIRARGKEDQRGGGLDLWVLGSHLLNLITYFAGKPLTCTANIYQNGKLARPADVKKGDEGVGLIVGDEIHAQFEMEAGFPVYFDSVKGAGIGSAGFGLQIIGNKGIIDVRADKEPAAHLLRGSPFQPSPEARSWIPITSGGIGKPEPIEGLEKLMIQHTLAGRDLIQAVQKDQTPLCHEKEAALTIEMIAAVFASHVQNGQRVSIPLKDRGNPLEKW